MPTQKPKLAFKGRDRHRIKQLQNFIKQIQDMDTRNAARAAELGIPAVRFDTVGVTSYAANLTALATRCGTALTQTVSAQAVPLP